MRHESDTGNNFLDLIKMKLMFSNDNSFNFNNIAYTIFTFIVMTVVTNIINNNIFFEDFNYKSAKHTLWSFFYKESKIYIEGKRCFVNGPYSRRYENLFSMSFYAIWQYVGNLLTKSEDIYSIKECSGFSSKYDDYGCDINMFTSPEDIAYVVEQKHPFKLNDKIWCTVHIINEDIENNGSNNKVSTKVENIQIKIFSYTASVFEIREFVRELTDKYIDSLQESREGKKYIYTYEGTENNDDNPSRSWSECDFSTNTSFDNIFFEQKEFLLKKIDFFINNSKWYEHHGKPYTLGIGLSGPPGTGKTSIIKSVAKKLNRHLIVIPLNKISTTSEFTKVFYESKYIRANKNNSIDFTKKIIVFEDIDCMSNIVFSRDEEGSPNKDKEKSNDKNDSNAQLISSVIKACKDDDYTGFDKNFSSSTVEDKLTLSFILNIIDGIRETPGRIIMITSNYYHKLDKALVRPGRIDISLSMEYATRNIIKDMFNHFYLYDDKSDFDSTLKSMNINIEDIPDKKISQAKLVEYYCSDPNEFIKKILSHN